MTPSKCAPFDKLDLVARDVRGLEAIWEIPNKETRNGIHLHEE
jgi:hypothetical protein